MTNEQLAAAVAAGDRRAASLLVTRNRGIVAIAARRLACFCHHLKFEDLMQEGLIGLLKAAAKFDPSRGTAFTTYAHWWIFACMMRALTDTEHTIRSSKRVHELMLAMRSGKDVTDDPTYSAYHHEAVQALIRPALSLDASVFYDDGAAVTFLDLRASDAPTPDQLVEKVTVDQRMRATVSDALRQLPPREREVLQLRWFADPPLTLQEVGDRWGICRERVRQIELRAKNKVAEIVPESARQLFR